MPEIKENSRPEPGGNTEVMTGEAMETGKPETAEDTPSCCGCATQRHKARTQEERKALMRRLAIIEGQIRGVRGMLEKDIYCTDILTQVSAVNSALNSFSRELLAEHMRTCVADDIRGGNTDKLDELLKLLPRLMK